MNLISNLKTVFDYYKNTILENKNCFSLTSIFVTYINGVVLGVVFGYIPARGFANPLQIFLLIVPHGIFEYLGTFLAMSFGLRLGINWILEKKGKSRWEVF